MTKTPINDHFEEDPQLRLLPAPYKTGQYPIVEQMVGGLVIANVDPELARQRLSELLGEEATVLRKDTDSSGNPLEDHRKELKQEIRNMVGAIDIGHKPEAKGDLAIYELLQAMLIATAMVGKNDRDIGLIFRERGEVNAQSRDKTAPIMLGVLDHGALWLLNNAFDLARAGEDQVQQFIEENCPSPMWKNERLKMAALFGIQKTYELFGAYNLNPKGDTTKERHPFIMKLQRICASEVNNFRKEHGSKGVKKENLEAFMKHETQKAEQWWFDTYPHPDRPSGGILLSA